VDFRDLNPTTLDSLFAILERHAAEIGAATNTRFTIRTTQRSEPALADARLMEVVAASAGALGLSSQRMPSGAGHDAQSMARIAPMAMIFVPSVGGISHAPQEYTSPEDCAHGVDLLLNAVIAADAL
jgi:N-carbamoyl-L-amino-acid hydrolase